MSDWVHCNKCSLRHSNQNSFFLVECGHIFCHRCVEKIKSSNKCSICNKSGHVIMLNKSIEQNVLDFFLPVENHFKKAVEVYKFQMQHRNTLLQNLLEKYNYAKKEYLNCHNTNKQLMKDNQMLRSMLISLNNSEKSQRSHSTPLYAQSATNPVDVTFQDSSIVSTIRPHTMTPSESNRNMKLRFPGYPKRNKHIKNKTGALFSSIPSDKSYDNDQTFSGYDFYYL